MFRFGDNIEDYLGHFRYAVFYLVCGIIASLAHVFYQFGFGNSQSRRVGRDFGRVGRLFALVPQTARDGFSLSDADGRSRLRRPGSVDSDAGWTELPERRARRRGLRGAHRRLHRGPRARQSLRSRTQSGLTRAKAQTL